MMNKKVFVKLIALLMAAAMLLGVCACSATDNNPTIGKIGKVKILSLIHISEPTRR